MARPSSTRARRLARRRPLRVSLARRRLVAAAAFAVVVIAVVFIVMTHRGSGPERHSRASVGIDVSWPQCAGATAIDLPQVVPSYVVIGVTDGSGDSVDPCLNSQLAWARSRQVPVGAYVAMSFPTAAQLSAATRGTAGNCSKRQQQRLCRIRNAGAEQVEQALIAMHRVGLHPPLVWLDIETRTKEPWRPAKPWLDRAAINAAAARLAQSGLGPGIYSTSTMWDEITGGEKLRVPGWVPVGAGTVSDGEAACQLSASGGPTLLGQSTQTLDDDVICLQRQRNSAAAVTLQAMIHRFAT